jgi:hypothetical protein
VVTGFELQVEQDPVVLTFDQELPTNDPLAIDDDLHIHGVDFKTLIADV